jgi:hypothetical protein
MNHPAAVRRRHVFFLSGFDPKGASYYHGLYLREAAIQATVTGTSYEVGARARAPGGNSVWEIRHDAEIGGTATTFEYVRWDDIVRANWARHGWRVLAGSLRGYSAALASWSALRKVWHASPRTLVALAIPAAFWIAALTLSVVIGLAVGQWLSWLFASALGWVIGAGTSLGIAWGFLRLEDKLGTTWLLRIYEFAGAWSRGRVTLIEQRLDTLAADLRKRLEDPAIDEVLLIGFSVGSLLAVSATARLQQAARQSKLDLSRLALVTLGNCIPLLGLMKGAGAFRAELALLGQEPHVAWVDFSSVTDWGSFALVDPLALCLDGSAERIYRPQVASPRFHLMFEPEQYARIVKNKRRMHMQYLMAGQRPTVYDYFAITAGPQRLCDRLKGIVAT